MFEWSDIRILLSVAKAGSTLQAAKALGLNQTTVSRRIDSLEHALGLKLFDRDTRGYSLTSQGRSIVAISQGMQEISSIIQTRADTLKRSKAGHIRITAVADAMLYWVNPVTSAFQEKFPNVTFELDDSAGQTDLKKGEADIAFRPTDCIADENLIARMLGKAVWAIYCSKAYVRKVGMPKSIEDLKQHNLVSYSPKMVARIKTLQDFEDQIDLGKISQTCNTTHSLSTILETKLAVGLLPVVSGQARPELVHCFTDPMFHQNVWLITSSDAYQTPLIRKFMKFAGDFRLKDGLTLV